ncbi:MAG TPA: thiol reductant ABC exporter subunit CydC [Alcanivoracaceae bacterium]|nr:thiol reductant ABC exporter subunit CydC [Alcanivoracaceae bacterium]
MTTPNSITTYQWLKKRFAPMRSTLALAALLAILTAFSGMSLLGLAGWFIGASALAGLVGAGLTFNLFSPSAGIRGFALSRTVFRYFERLVSHNGTFKVMQSLRTQLFSIILPRIPGPLSGISQGHLLERLLGDVERLEGAWLEQAQPSILAFFISLFLLFVFFVSGQYTAALAFMLLLVALAIFLIRGSRKVLVPMQKLSEHKESLRSELIQALTGLPEVIAYQIRPRLLTRWDKELTDLSTLEHRLVKHQAMSSALIQSSLQLLAVGVFLLAIPHVLESNMTGPAALASMLLILAAVEVFQPLARSVQRWQETRSTVGRMMDIENSPLPQQACRGTAVPTPNQELVITNLGFSWNAQKPLFEKLNVTVTPDTSLAIVGASGSGKSTLLHCLMGLQSATQGSIEFGGVQQTQADEKAWRQQFSLLLQQQQLFTGSLRDNLRIANPQASDEQLWHALRLARLEDMVLERGGLDFMVGPEGLHLSGGQARRLALARVLLQDTPVVLLDEPFTGLEEETADALLADIQTIFKDKILVMVTHNENHSKKFKQVFRLK